MSKLVGFKTKQSFDSFWEQNLIDQYSLNFIINTGQIYTHGVFINGAAFGTVANNAVPLTVAGDTKTLALSSHTHSNYLEKNANIDIGNYKIVSGNQDLMSYSEGNLYIGNTSSPTYISGSALYSVKGQNTETILDTGNFSVSSPSGYYLGNAVNINYAGNSFRIDYVKKNSTSAAFDSLASCTQAGTNLLNGSFYGYITLSTDGTQPNPYWAQLRINIPSKIVQFRTSADTTNWINLTAVTNSSTAAGIVPAGQASSVYMTDDNKNPSWTSIDTTVTSNSSHLVTSGAVYNAIANSISSAVTYLGTVGSENAMKGLSSAQFGDFARIITSFTFTDATGETVTAHVGDIVYLISNTTGAYANSENWIVAHTEIDTNTWLAASTTAAGYIPQLTTGGAALNDSSNDYVLAFVNGTNTAPVWKKLPSNAYSNTTYTVTDTTGINLSSTVLSLNVGIQDTLNDSIAATYTADRFYQVVTDKNKKLSVVVPWTAYSLVSTSVSGLVPAFSLTNKVNHDIQNDYYFLGWQGNNLKWYTLPNKSSWNYDDVYTKHTQAIPYIEGPSTDTTAGTWTGTCDKITAYADGITILYVPAVAGASTTTLDINGLGARTCYFTNTSKLTTHFAVGTPILLTYKGGYWKRADYDSDSNTQYYLTLNGAVKGTSGSTNLGSIYAPETSGNGFLKCTINNNVASWSYDNNSYSLSTHTHTLGLEVDSGTSTIDLNSNTTYKLVAGGSTLIFKTPADSSNVTSALYIGASNGTGNAQVSVTPYLIFVEGTSYSRYKLEGAGGITVSSDASGNIKFTGTTYSVFTGATSANNGSTGLVKQPLVADRNSFLRGDCTWQTIAQYKLTLNGTTNGTSSGTSLGTLYAVATSNATAANQVWMRNDENTAYAWRTLGSNAFIDKDTTLTLTRAAGNLTKDTWTDAVTMGTAVAGTYVVNFTYDSTVYSGIFSYNSNDTLQEEISLHAAGTSTTRIYARINGTKLQIASNAATFSMPATDFKFRKLL